VIWPGRECGTARGKYRGPLHDLASYDFNGRLMLSPTTVDCWPSLASARRRYAFEYWNISWFIDSIYRILEDLHSAHCPAESEKLETPI